MEKDFEKLNEELGNLKLENHFEKIENIAEYIKLGKCKNIIVLAGAGISTSCGIPDFRSKDTGIFSKLESYDLPYPEALFELNYFKKNPEPFFKFTKVVLQTMLEAKPSITHYFIRLLAEKNLLRRIYTQNIDDLEKKAGVPKELICQAHGTYSSAKCLNCGRKFKLDDLKDKLTGDDIPKCYSCEGIIKPKIIFYGESLPEKFFTFCQKDFKVCDLLIVLGTSLKVYPVAGLVSLVDDKCPRLLINKEYLPQFYNSRKCVDDNNEDSSSSNGLMEEIQDRGYFNDVIHLDTTDSGCNILVDLLGWKSELDMLINK